MPRCRRAGNLNVRVIAIVVLTLSLCCLGSGTAREASAATKATFTPGLLARVPNSNTVYLLGEASCGSHTCLRLLRTSSNGASFVAATAPPAHLERGSNTGDLRELVFANSRDGYALVGADNQTTVYATANGATTWTRVTVVKGRDVESLTTTAHELYALTMRCPNENGNCTDYRLARSSLSAQHWTSTALPHGGNTQGGFLGNIAAYGSRVWFTEQFHTTLLYSSTNDGRTFARRSLAWPTLTSVAGCALTANSATSLWAECPTGMQVSYYASGNGDVTWTPILSNLQKMGTGGVYFDPVSSNLAILDVGLESNGLYRIAAAAHHVTLAGHLACYSFRPEFVFTDAAHGLAICDPSAMSTSLELERTDDGGTTWTHVTIYATSRPTPVAG